MRTMWTECQTVNSLLCYLIIMNFHLNLVLDASMHFISTKVLFRFGANSIIQSFCALFEMMECCDPSILACHQANTI